MKSITHGGRLLALVISVQDFVPGINFVSQPEWPFQLGLLMHDAGHSIVPHVHLPQPERKVPFTQEFLLVKEGRMEVDFYGPEQEFCCTETLVAGEALLHIEGGHGFRFMEPTRLIELKQGPYAGREADKQNIATSKRRESGGSH